MINKWLQYFVYRAEINRYFFKVVTLMRLVISSATVMFHTIEAARSNPAAILKYEQVQWPKMPDYLKAYFQFVCIFGFSCYRIKTEIMSKRKGLSAVLLPLVIAICIFVVFYSIIDCKPNHAGFWFIFVLGMATGAALTRIILWKREKNDK